MLSPEYMENKGMVIDIWHAPTGHFVKFRAYLTEFSDSYDQNWDEEAVFGRMDEHQVFRNTKRTINLGWKIVSEDIFEAKTNMDRISLLAQMQYPVYNNTNPNSNQRSINTATSIQGSPIFRLKFLNWVQDATAAAPQGDAHNSGLVGTMRNFSFSPVLETGYFHNEGQFDSLGLRERTNDPNSRIEDQTVDLLMLRARDRRFQDSYEALRDGVNGSMYAKEIDVSIQYHVLHTHQVGWNGKKSFKSNYPYGEAIGQKVGRIIRRAPYRDAQSSSNSSIQTAREQQISNTA